MPALSSLFAALSAKGVAAAAAGTLMVGGGVAVAQSVPPDTTPDVTPEDVPEDVVPDRDEVPDDIGPAEVEEGTEDPDGDSGEIQNLELDGDLEEDEGSEDPEIENVEEGERSETAKAVHRALTGYDGTGEEITPGHPDFGATVSARAREGGLGKAVSEAARSANPGHAGEGTTDEDEDEDEGSVELSSEDTGRPDHAGPPAGKGKAGK